MLVCTEVILLPMFQDNICLVSIYYNIYLTVTIYLTIYLGGGMNGGDVLIGKGGDTIKSINQVY